MSRLRIGAVSYLNARPLVYGLDEPALPLELIYDVPSRLAERMASGDLDVGLIPVVEALGNPVYTVVSNACIACRGPVRSVQVYSRVPFSDVKSIALDEGSRTSVILTKVIFHERFGNTPHCELLRLSHDWRDTAVDAVLVIGDRAMTAAVSQPNGQKGISHPFPFQMDLGEYWNEWTGLPFVFAVWAARPGLNCGWLECILNESRDRGLTNIDLISSRHAEEVGINEAECREYLTRHLHYYFGPREKSGLERFVRLAKRCGMIDQRLGLQFYDCEVVG